MTWWQRALVAGAVVLLIGADPAPAPRPLDYAVVDVTRKLVRETPGGDERLDSGDTARSGDVLSTGWWSRAELEAAERASRFHLGSRTRVRLAHDAPGVLLEIQRGRLRALFAPLAEDAERTVITPAAVLAVRGTEYGVEVAGDGTTTVAVFEGLVDVTDRDRTAPTVRIGAGQSTRVRPGRAPDPPRGHGLSGEDWDRGRRPPDPDRGSGGGSPGMGPEGSPGRQPGPSGPSQQSPGQQQGGARKGKG